MNRRKLITTIAAMMVAQATGALAQDFGAGIVAQLKSQGFTDISVSTTWLGRLRILAARADGQREIIANPRTGEILRDIWTGTRDGSKTAIIDQVGNGGDDGGSGSGSSGGGSSGGGSSGGTDGGSDDGGSHGGSDDGGGSGGSDDGGSSGGSSGGGSPGGGSGSGSGSGGGGGGRGSDDKGKDD